MKGKKWIVMCAVSLLAVTSATVPAEAKIKAVCSYQNCTAKGTHKHGHTKYRTSCRYAACNKTSCTKTGVHKHKGITYASCGNHSSSHHGHSGHH